MKVFAVAGEASGDRLGGALFRGLKERLGTDDVSFLGVGGGLMSAEGLTSQFPMHELSVMGIAEVLPKYPALRRRMVETAEAVVAAKPDVLVTIDSPDFGLRVAKRAKAAWPSLRTVHYVAPSVWAWRPKRAAKMAPYIDQVLCLLPFEPPYMEAHGMRADFVGHPVTTEQQATEAEVRAFRDEHGLGDAPILLLLPGSRRSELSKLLPIFGAVVQVLTDKVPGLRCVLPCAPGILNALEEGVSGWNTAPLIIAPDQTGQKKAAFVAADVALAASGTVSLELAAAHTPMVIAYDMNWLSWQIMSRAALIDTVTLVNLVSETRAVPEFLGPACQPAGIASALESLLHSGDARAAQLDAMTATMERLGRGGPAPGLRAADAILSGLGR